MHNVDMILQQDLTDHVVQLSAAGCNKIFTRTITDATSDRPKLRKLVLSRLAPFATCRAARTFLLRDLHDAHCDAGVPEKVTAPAGC